jgi:hypothetical protein
MAYGHDEERRDRVCRHGAEEWKRVKEERDWTSYMAIGEAFLIGRQWAFDLSGTNNNNDPRYKKAFSAWLVKYGFDDFDRSDRAKLYTVMENRGAIETWRSTLGLTQRLKLNHPSTVLRQWKAATQVPKSGEPKTSPITKLKQKINELERQHELDEERIAAADGGDLFNWKTTSAEKIAATIIANVGVLLTPTKAKKIATEMLRLLDDKPKAAEPKKKTAKVEASDG